MSALPRLVRAVHTSAVRLEAAAAAAAAPAAAEKVGQTTGPTGLPIDFTAKGRPIYTRPARTTRVTLPSGYPEPSTYPPPPEYFEEINKITASLGRKGPKRHPLWAFFNVPEQSAEPLKQGDQMPDMGSVVRIDEEDAAMGSGRAWATDELRRKSFEDLHILWYVLLRERNVLATQKAERKRIGINEGYGGALIKEQEKRCKTSMARIKAVLNERRLAIAATAAPHAATAAASAGALPIIPLALPTSALSDSALDALAAQGKVARTASGATVFVDTESTAAYAPGVDVQEVLAKLAAVRASPSVRRKVREKEARRGEAEANRIVAAERRAAKAEAHAELLARLEKERPARKAAEAERKAQEESEGKEAAGKVTPPEKA